MAFSGLLRRWQRIATPGTLCMSRRGPPPERRRTCQRARVSFRARAALLLPASACVESVGSTCFRDCGAKTGNARRNVSSPCWIKCFYDAVLGPSGSKPGYDNSTAAGMTTAEIQAAWAAPFQSEDASRGGCPAMPL